MIGVVKTALRAVSLFAVAGAFAALLNSAHAQALSAQEEARLYEAAKKEGVLSEYVTLPLDIMTKVGEAFTRKYPGIKVEAIRLVGTTQYQRFMRETEAKQYLAEIGRAHV